MTLLPVLVGAAAVGTALVGGVFFAFSGFVLRALGTLDAGAEAMRAVNRAAVRPPLMLALFGTAALCVLVPVLGGGAPVLLVAAGLYLLGTVGVTVVANVPLNDRLEADAGAWDGYRVAWGRANAVRTVAALASSAAHLGALAHLA